MSIVEPRNNMTLMTFKQIAVITLKIRADFEKLHQMNPSNASQITNQIFEVSESAYTIYGNVQ